MANCAACGKNIPADEMTSRKGAMDFLGIGSGDDNPLAKVARAMGAATQAWKCDNCGEWICNDCVCGKVTATGAGQIQHNDCGGMFRAPD